MYSIASKLTHSGTESATVLTGEKVMVTQGLGKGQIMSLEDWLILADENEITVVQKLKAAAKVRPLITLNEELQKTVASQKNYIKYLINKVISLNSQLTDIEGGAAHAASEAATTKKLDSVVKELGDARADALKERHAHSAEETEVLRVAGVPKAEEIAVGTKFKWKKDDDNFRVAIQTKKGFLQVVEVMNGTCIQAKVPTYYEMEGRRGPETFTSYYAWAKALPPGNIIRTEADNSSTFQKKVATSYRSHKL